MKSEKFISDAIWSYLAFALMAISGLAVNFTLGLTKGAEALGLFNQTMALYLIASHFAVFGIHNATLYYVAAYPRNASRIFRSALLPLFITASSVSTLLYLLADILGEKFASPDLGQSVRYASLALVFFAFNKVALAYLNGRMLMRMYALGQSARYLSIFSVVLIICIKDLPLGLLGSSFLIAECLTSLLLLFYLAIRAAPFGRPPVKYHKMIVSFAVRSAGAGLLNEMNLRVDILALGYFLSDKEVGIYSFAAMFVEGFYNVGLVVRNVLNPYIVKTFKYRDFNQFSRWCRKLNIFNAALAALIFSAVYCLYEPVIGGLLGMNEFLAARPVVIILFLFMSVYFIFIPYEEIVMVSGNPLRHTVIYVCVISTNILLNVILIPHWGLAGAAISTGLALMVMLFTVLVYSRRKLGINVLTGSVGIY